MIGDKELENEYVNVGQKIFFQLISIDSVEKVHLDILSNSVVIFSKKDLSIATIKKEVFGLQIYEMT